MGNKAKRIKVMHVAECVGGVDRYLRSLLKYMNHDKFENIVVLSQLYKSEDYIILADEVETLRMTHSMGIKTLLSAVGIRKLIKKYEPDIVYAHSSIAGAITRLANIGMKSKCIYNPHGWSFNMETNKKYVFILLERLMALFCEVIICISDAEKESALKRKICVEHKLCVVYNGIDFEESQRGSIDRGMLNIPDDAFVVGMVGRICRQKAPDTFIKMAGEIIKKVENTYFIIVGNVLEGEREEKKEIEDFAVKNKIRLYITGWVNNPLDYIKVFDVACLLSRWEGFGLVIPEYMLCEKPIVATNVEAIPNLITDMENGILVDVDDYNSAANAVIELNKNTEFKSKLVRNGIDTVHKRFDVRRVAEQSEKIIEQLWGLANQSVYKKNGYI
ncbi:MAG: glycosyltransferase family 4 protein [Lachnospiraceae bacterium]|jgi:glycosyltransferase involved in cell wall biosynthesis|nr:glycosyltransferase [uncultured Acetatifactor sp.]MCI9219209.1 glycosyltransferase family 4 protein [Lachnospiraceae bacterium]